MWLPIRYYFNDLASSPPLRDDIMSKEAELELIEVEDIKVKKGMTVDELMRYMSGAGGFTAQKLADASNLI